MHRLYANTTKGLGHLKILVSAGDPGTNPHWIPRDDCSYDSIQRQELKKILVEIDVWNECFLG